MDNSKIISAAQNFRERLRSEIDENSSHSEDMKFWLWKTLIMAEIAHRSFSLQTSIETFEKQYFDRYAAVARHFRDWDMDWVADNYYEITNYVGKYYWPNNDKNCFNKDYIPFKQFDILS
jgi:hypothetical protein